MTDIRVYIATLLATWQHQYMEPFEGSYFLIFAFKSRLNRRDWLGQSTWKKVNGKWNFEININSVFSKDKLCCRVILWHEFCHLMDVLTDIDGGHDGNFYHWYIKKPHYILAEYTICLPMFIWRML